MNKEKIQLEFEMHASSGLLFNYISGPTELAEWFADTVTVKGDWYTFEWEGSIEVAELIKVKEDEYVRFRRIEDEDSKYYFEMRIDVDEITDDVSLIITDFAEEDDVDETILAWKSSVADLKHTIGS